MALGIPKLLVTCNAAKQASEKTILANGGVFDSVGLSKSYIYSLANRIEKLSPKEDPLILDVSALKY